MRRATIINGTWRNTETYEYLNLYIDEPFPGRSKNLNLFNNPFKAKCDRKITYVENDIIITDTPCDSETKHVTKISLDEIVCGIIENGLISKFVYGDIISISMYDSSIRLHLWGEYIYDGDNWIRFSVNKLPDKFTTEDKIVWCGYKCRISPKIYNVKPHCYRYYGPMVCINYTLNSDTELVVKFSCCGKEDKKIISQNKHHVFNTIMQLDKKVYIEGYINEKIIAKRDPDPRICSNFYTNISLHASIHVSDLLKYVAKWNEDALEIVKSILPTDLAKIVIGYA